MDFPDAPHLLQLQRELWKWPKSRASIMVGAGFSLNARPLPGVTSRFPLWSDLVRSMYSDLYPFSSQNFNSANALRIASEYEAAFGRVRLNELIRFRIPDLDYAPGDLHTQLLDLPWVDVFTTNYDTLLERTELLGRSYSPVSDVQQLITTTGPRIVKLHGCFRASTSKLIITEEDFRSYPRDFAPFVNTVQQSLLENVFVLLGFSGDDPNFLSWTGWIRDHLAEKHAPIYLVGSLELQPAARALINKRGVTPIDLAPVFAGHPRHGDKAAALEWFISCLSRSRPSRPEKWPENQPKQDSNHKDLPDLLGIIATNHESSLSLPNYKEPLAEEGIIQIIQNWQKGRRCYPGWIIAPLEKRNRIWNEMKVWLPDILSFSEQKLPIERLTLFNEINWRLEVALVPLFNNWKGEFEKAIDDLFEDVAAGTVSVPKSTWLQMPFNKNEIAKAWLDLAFALLREARETHEESRWQKLKNQIEKIADRYQLEQDRLHYEKALWTLWNVDRHNTREILSKWTPSRYSPHAAMKKASLLAEVDELGEANSLLRQALQQIRTSLQKHGENIELLSLEGWCTYALALIHTSITPNQRNSLITEFSERWQDLLGVHCNPFTIRKELEAAVTNATFSMIEKQNKDLEHKPLFLFTYNVDDLPGYAFIRWFEEACIPMKLRYTNVVGEHLGQACQLIEDGTNFWSPAILVRAGRFESLKKETAKLRIAKMDIQLVRRIYRWCEKILVAEMNAVNNGIDSDAAQSSILTGLPELLSNFLFRLSPEELKESFDTAILYHKLTWNNPSQKHNRASEIIWFQRLFEAAETDQLLDWLPALISLSPLHSGASNEESPWYVDPIQWFPTSRLKEQRAAPGLEERIKTSTDWLISRTLTESQETQKSCILRLLIVHQTGYLTPSQETSFAKLLWGEHCDRIPEIWNTPWYQALHLPRHDPQLSKKLIREKILSLSPFTGGAIEFGDNNEPLRIRIGKLPVCDVVSASWFVSKVKDETSILWTPEECSMFWKKSQDWWEKAKKRFNTPFDREILLLDRMGQTIAGFLKHVIIPHQTIARNEIREWISDLKQHGIFVYECLPYLDGAIADRQSLSEEIMEGLCSNDELAIASAANAIRTWIKMENGQNQQPAPLTGPLDSLIQRVVLRRKLGLRQCIQQVIRIIIERPDALNSNQVAQLTSCLDGWIDIIDLNQSYSREISGQQQLTFGPDIAFLSSLLASGYAKSTSDETSKMLLSLKSFAENSPLPEVRRAWFAGKRVRKHPRAN